MITKKVVNHVASLAKISIPEEQMATVSDNLKKILNYVEQLGSVNTHGVEPMYNPVVDAIVAMQDQHGAREDKVQASIPVGDVLSNCAETKQNQFAVHAVINED